MHNFIIVKWRDILLAKENVYMGTGLYFLIVVILLSKTVGF